MKPDSITIISLDDINEKQTNSLGGRSFLEKEHLQKIPRGIPVVTHFFFVDSSPHVEFIIKEL